jgi:hypothetical protein
MQLIFLICIYKLIKKSNLSSQQLSEEVRSLLEAQFESDKICKVSQLRMIGHDRSEKEKPCNQSDVWGYLKLNRWYLTESIKKKFEGDKAIICKYRAIKRIDDMRIGFAKYKPLLDRQFVEEEIIEVFCELNKTLTQYSNSTDQYKILLAQVVKYNESNFKKQLETDQCRPMSIMLLSYDSVSRVSWLKRLPLTNSFILNEMKFDVLTGYNILGDGK